MKILSTFIIIFFLTVSLNLSLAQQQNPQITSGKADINWDKANEIIASIKSTKFIDKTYLVTDFGAVADGKTACKNAFEKAINQCSEAGGGKIIVPAGNYYMNGPLVFKSNVCIELQKGAVLNFSSNVKDYLPLVLTKFEGTEVYNYSPLIYAYQATNIALIGKGTINGNGAQNFSNWKNLQNKDKTVLRKMGTDGVPVYERIFGEGHYLRPSFFQPFGCSNVLLEGITILDSPFWVIHPVYCDNVIIRGVTVKSYNTNNDGCDPESSSNVLIEDCVFATGDDAIAIKAGRDNDAWRVGRATENVVIRNCVFESKINGVCIGSEISGGVRNVFIENIKIPKSANAIYFKSNTNRGGFIENIFVRNIHADSVKETLIRFEPNYKGEGKMMHPTNFNGFYLENITSNLVEGCGLYLAGLEISALKNVTLSNIEIKKTPVAYGLKFAEHIVFKDVVVNGEKLAEKPEEKTLVKLTTF